ncbi:uncharacterized protein LOC119654315 isoform X2 [Hermetia illucens]|uniref:uncharacterized protein LOC119654315 isoform X2 n=1 Tax=Hermetia illucens TaxID=343691 RepID=UPI0018CC2355|nr:uncharacterized protein LOC119654315 isoform X2 [Hermetia illucens]
MFTRELAGDFVMYLYNNGFILNNRVASKIFIRRKFKSFLQENNRSLGAYDHDSTLDQLLQDHQFVCNYIKDEKIYKFDMRGIFKYRNEVIAQLDEKEIEKANNIIMDAEALNKVNSIDEKPKVLADFPTYSLIFQFKLRQTINDSFILSSKGCYCCQRNFVSEEEYTAHIEHHSQESDFEYREQNRDESLSQQFSVTYKLCEKSHLLFCIKPLDRENLIIEKIIVFRSGVVHYLEDALVPYFMPSDGSSFYVNCHIFQIAYEQPMLIIFKSKDDAKDVRYVEEHHFLRFDVFPGRRGELKIAEKLKEYSPTPIAKSMHFIDFDEKNHPIKRSIRDYFKKVTPLGPDNLCDAFDLLIEMEDFALSKVYEKFKRSNIKVEGCATDYSVMIVRSVEDGVDGVLSGGDRIILFSTQAARKSKGGKAKQVDEAGNVSNKGTKFIGVITNVVGERVYFESKSGKIPVDLLYDVSFEPQRLGIIYQHRALELLRADNFLKVRLFPEPVFNSTASLSLEYYNPNLAENPEQREAVQNIVDNHNKHVPFIIFGPPGTGKTTVVVEAILQLWKKSESNRILVMAGSNAACDEVASRVCTIFDKIDPEGMNLLRLYAMSSEKRIENMNEGVLEASNLCYGQHFYPSLETIYTYRIVIVTLSVAGRLVHGKIASNHFTHVFIDECGASTEPESLVGLAGILSSSGQLILSGDPKQLGPIIACRRAANYGLEVSMLERLMDRECYQQHPITKEYNRSIQTRLVRNFRSHKDILALPNQLFYDGQLQVMASPKITDIALGWSGLCTKTFPIVFESVMGTMRKLKNSTSSCNYEELWSVMLVLKELMFFGIKERKVRQEDIGIVSPYKMQCQLIRRELDRRGWYRIETGSVETFQGQEKPIIIASMVRSRVDTPGFLDNPRRLNVLLTRAQALLILVGNPETLLKIKHWNWVIKYCVENNAISHSMRNLALESNQRIQRSAMNPKNRLANMSEKGKSNANKGMNLRKVSKPNHIHRSNKKIEQNDQKDPNYWINWLKELPNINANSNSSDELEREDSKAKNEVDPDSGMNASSGVEPKINKNSNRISDFQRAQSEPSGKSNGGSNPGKSNCEKSLMEPSNSGGEKSNKILNKSKSESGSISNMLEQIEQQQQTLISIQNKLLNSAAQNSMCPVKIPQQSNKNSSENNSNPFTKIDFSKQINQSAFHHCACGNTENSPKKENLAPSGNNSYSLVGSSAWDQRPEQDRYHWIREANNHNSFGISGASKQKETDNSNPSIRSNAMVAPQTGNSFVSKQNSDSLLEAELTIQKRQHNPYRWVRNTQTVVPKGENSISPKHDSNSLAELETAVKKKQEDLDLSVTDIQTQAPPGEKSATSKYSSNPFAQLDSFVKTPHHVDLISLPSAAHQADKRVETSSSDPLQTPNVRIQPEPALGYPPTPRKTLSSSRFVDDGSPVQGASSNVEVSRQRIQMANSISQNYRSSERKTPARKEIEKSQCVIS